MTFRELNKDEFSQFSKAYPQNNFHQTIAWGELKATNGWKNYYVGLVNDKDEVVAASLLLSKKVIGKINIFYAPRGFLIDYKNYDVLKEFTIKIKKYAKSKGAIFIKMDPYVMYKERDIDGNLVEDGIDNSLAVDNLKKLKYIHKGFTAYQGTLQPRWMFVLDIENKTEEDILNNVYNQTTRHRINKTLNDCYILEEANIEQIEDFKKILEHTGKRRGFIDRPLSYYKNMYNTFTKYNMIKILIVKFDCEKYIDMIKRETEVKLTEKDELLEKLSSGYNEKIANKKLKEINNVLNANEKRLLETEQLKEQCGNIITMSAAMFILYGDEVVYLYSGTYEEYLKYDAPYRIQWEIIKCAIQNKYKRYNFYGISGEFDKSKESYGVYNFKKGFNGTVVELIGEFDLVINKILYNLYNFSYKVYRKIKNAEIEK